MLELPKQLPNLQRRLLSSLEHLRDWQTRAGQHQFTDDIQHWIRLFLACHQAAVACYDGDAIQAHRSTEQALISADLWRKSPSGRSFAHNIVSDQYAGIHDDVMSSLLASAAATVEDLLDWEFSSVSARASYFGFAGDHAEEGPEFHAEDAIRLCRMQAFRACCEMIVPVCLEQHESAYYKVQVAHHEIAAWKALVIQGTQQY